MCKHHLAMRCAKRRCRKISIEFCSIVFGFVEDGSKTLLTDLQMAFSQKDLRQSLFVKLKCKLD